MEHLGLTRIIAEIIQGYIEEYIDVLVGSIEKIEPEFLVEERIDYLIIGDIISDTIPSSGIQKWLETYWDIPKRSVRAVSGFYINLTNILTEPFWVEFLDDNVNAEMIFPPFLHLKPKDSNVALEDGAIRKIRAYSNDFIEFIIKNN